MSEKYALINAEKADPQSPYPTDGMCRWLSVSRSGFYEWRTATPSAAARRRVLLAGLVAAAFEAGRGTYGARRIRAVLGNGGHPVSLRLVRRLMREQGLRACQPRAYRTTTRPDPTAPARTDHLGRDFTATAPGVKLVGDITFIRTWEGWLYLATVIDCYSRRVVGWSMAEHMRTPLICAALDMAATNTALSPGCVFHSDRGSQYTSAEHYRHSTDLGVTLSAGATGVCWDNALAESFFAALKNELVYRTVFSTRKKTRRAIAEYIEVFYNRQRLHSTLGYQTPAAVEASYRQSSTKAA